MGTLTFEGQQLQIPDDIMDGPISEADLKKRLGVDKDKLLFARGADGSQELKGSIQLREGMQLGVVSDYTKG